MTKFKLGDRVKIFNIKDIVLQEECKEGDECIILRACENNNKTSLLSYYAIFGDEEERCDVELVESASPDYYSRGDIECIEAQKSALTHAEFIGYLKGQVMKYTWRMGLKGRVLVDAQKAKYYQDKLVEVLQNES